MTTSSKSTTIFTCTKCDAQFPKWSGRCTSCGAWGTLTEESVTPRQKTANEYAAKPGKPISFADIATTNEKRLISGLTEFDRVLGGGLVVDSLILLGGEPGVGKSTLIAQLAGKIAATAPVLYVSGEESASQIKQRFDRLNISYHSLSFLNETEAETVVATAKSVRPALLIIDSIQTIASSQLENEPGSVSQIRACAVKFLELAKQESIATVLIGHITKDGQIAGPKTLEHIVDAVLYLENETNQDYRMLRGSKNRFGSINELGIFQMTGQGFVEVPNPGALFIEQQTEPIPGSVISCLYEGSRPFMLEVQALVSKTIFGYPQRKCSGFDLNRLQVLTAVLTKRAGVNLTNQDIILNVVGGLKISEPALDAAVCLAIISSLLNQPVSRQLLVVGEVGLGGEIRPVRKLEERAYEAEKLGFTELLLPIKSKLKSKLKITPIKHVADLVAYLHTN